MPKILICDDSGFMRETLRDMLQNGGCEVVAEARDGDEAVSKFAEYRPDLVTMDLLMNPSGVYAIRKIMVENRSAQIIIITVLDGHQAEFIEAVRLGACGYVSKPFSQESLHHEVSRILGK